MARRLLRPTVVLVAAGALLAVGSPVALAGGDCPSPARATVTVVGDGDSVQVDRDRVPAGNVRFAVSSVNPTAAVGSAVVLFRLTDGVGLHQFFLDVGKEFSSDPAVAAEGTRLASQDATFLGLADVKPGVPLTVTERLQPGAYYLMDLTAPPSPDQDPQVVPFTVTGNGGHGDDHALADVHMRLAGDRFLAPTVWPHEGTVSVRNVDDTVHFVLLQPVPPGTTDEQVQQGLESGAPPFLPSPPAVGSEVLSPGHGYAVDYDLPRGTYVLLCFVADEETGMPHALMGMHLVVTLG